MFIEYIIDSKRTLQAFDRNERNIVKVFLALLLSCALTLLYTLSGDG